MCLRPCGCMHASTPIQWTCTLLLVSDSKYMGSGLDMRLHDVCDYLFFHKKVGGYREFQFGSSNLSLNTGLVGNRSCVYTDTDFHTNV